MIREIGSEFHATIDWGSQHHIRKGPVWKDHNYVYLRSGREAIGFVLDDIGRDKKKAILPAYICHSMLEPFLVRGYQVSFFGIDECFNPDLGDFRDSLRLDPDVVLYIDWFGMDKNKELISLAKGHSDRLLLVSDNTHNCFEGSSMDIADYCIARLRKWFSLPDGAVAVSNRSSFGKMPVFEENAFVALRKKAMMLKADYLVGGDQDLKVSYRKLLADAESLIDDSSQHVGVSPFSERVIEQADYERMKLRRRKNCNTLATHLTRLSLFPEAVEHLTQLESPFCFPIRVEQGRNELQRWLADRGIYCPVLWPLPRDISRQFEIATYLSNQILAIPCDHRYDESDMEFVAHTITAYFR